MTDAAKYTTDLIIGRSLITAESIAQELRERLVRRLAGRRMAWPELHNLAREILAEFEPLLAETLAESEIMAFVAGADQVFKRLPLQVKDLFERTPGGVLLPPGPPGGQPPILAGDAGGEDQPIIRLPLIERARERLLERGALTRDRYDRLSEEAKRRAFTVAYQSSEETIERIRDALAETIEQGASLTVFRENLEDAIGKGSLGPAHLENVYRTNIQQQFHEGHDELASNPIVDEIFPYQEYLPIHDGRVREDHAALGKLGLSGTGIYRRDDPMWDLFSPPWGFQCRCGINLMTIEDAAAAGVKEAQRWLRTGEPPAVPEWRLDDIPFRPEPGFSRRGAVTV